MKLADLATGPDWTMWIIFGIFTVLSIVLLSGHGSWFIAILILIMGLFENFLPAFFVYIASGIIVVDVVVIIILENTLCKK